MPAAKPSGILDNIIVTVAIVGVVVVFGGFRGRPSMAVESSRPISSTNVFVRVIARDSVALVVVLVVEPVVELVVELVALERVAVVVIIVVPFQVLLGATGIVAGFVAADSELLECADSIQRKQRVS